MPASYLSERSQSDERKSTGHILTDSVKGMHAAAHTADAARSESVKVSAEISQYERDNGEYVRASPGLRAQVILIVLLIVSIYILDLFFFGGTAAMLAKSRFPGSVLAIHFIRFLVPAVVLVAEMGIAFLIYKSLYPDPVAATGTLPKGKKRSFNLWLLLGMAFAFVMPLLVISTDPDVVRYMAAETTLATLLSARILSIVGVVLACHILTIFTGKYSAQAKRYFLARREYRALTERRQQLDDSFEANAQEVVNLYNEYVVEFDGFNRRHVDAPIPRAAFDAVTRGLLNERLGYTAIQGPNAEQQGIDAQGPSKNGSRPPVPNQADAASRAERSPTDSGS